VYARAWKDAARESDLIRITLSVPVGLRRRVEGRFKLHQRTDSFEGIQKTKSSALASQWAVLLGVFTGGPRRY
jgi:hypothetical protein